MCLRLKISECFSSVKIHFHSRQHMHIALAMALALAHIRQIPFIKWHPFLPYVHINMNDTFFLRKKETQKYKHIIKIYFEILKTDYRIPKVTFKLAKKCELEKSETSNSH